MIILLCGRDQCGLNAHSVDPDSMRIESWFRAYHFHRRIHWMHVSTVQTLYLLLVNL